MSSGVGRNLESSDDDDTDEDDGEWQEGRYTNAGPLGPTRRRSTSGFDVRSTKFPASVTDGHRTSLLLLLVNLAALAEAMGYVPLKPPCR